MGTGNFSYSGGEPALCMRVLTSRRSASESVLSSESSAWRGFNSSDMRALLRFAFSNHSVLVYPASVQLAVGKSVIMLPLPATKGDEMCLIADFYCAKLHIFTTKSYKSEAVATYNHRLPFISYYILDCLTSNIFDIKCKLFMDIRLTQTNIATNKCGFIQPCTWDFFFCIFV